MNNHRHVQRFARFPEWVEHRCIEAFFLNTRANLHRAVAQRFYGVGQFCGRQFARLQGHHRGSGVTIRTPGDQFCQRLILQAREPLPRVVIQVISREVHPAGNQLHVDTCLIHPFQAC